MFVVGFVLGYMLAGCSDCGFGCSDCVCYFLFWCGFAELLFGAGFSWFGVCQLVCSVGVGFVAGWDLGFGVLIFCSFGCGGWVF